MNIKSKLSGHWTDEELVDSIYGVGPENKHLASCGHCQSRLEIMQANRRVIENMPAASSEVNLDFLAAQRRAIYARLYQPVRWWSPAYLRRAAAGLATLAVLTGSVLVYERNREVELANDRIADAQLLQEVSAMATDSGTQATEPLQGLFE